VNNLSNVIILAGGFGTRMSKKFPNTPKPLIKINGIPILEHILIECRKNNLKNILISVHHKKKQIEKCIGNGEKFGLNVNYAVEEQPAGTGGAISLCLNRLEENFLVLYADVFFVVNLKKLLSTHIHNNNDITAVVHPNDHPFDSDLVSYDKKLNIYKVYSKKDIKSGYLKNSVLAAMYCFNKKIFKYKMYKNNFDIGKDFLPDLINKNCKIVAYPTIEYLKDMGTPERFIKVETAIKEGIVNSRSYFNKKKAIIMDRDGTINIENGLVKKPKDLILIKKSGKAIKKINNSKYLSLCATNQPVIARGDCSIKVLENIHNKLDTELSFLGAYLDDYIYCPHHPKKGYAGEVKEFKVKCDCRKPNNGMLKHFIIKYNLDETLSFMIGDRFSDILAAEKSNMNSILILEGAINKQYDLALRPTHISINLSDAVTWILNSYDKIRTVLNDKIPSITKQQKIIVLESKDYLQSLSAAKILKQYYIPDIIIIDFFFDIVNNNKKSVKDWIRESQILTSQTLANWKSLFKEKNYNNNLIVIPVKKSKNSSMIEDQSILKINLEIM
jgi:D,D-heptose 1,7-bisphosphate phosphatase